MQALLDFADAVETSDEALLGEDFHNGELVVRYREGRTRSIQTIWTPA